MFRFVCAAALIASTALAAPVYASTVSPAAAPTATASAYAKIGLIEASGFPGQLALSADDTVYVPTEYGGYVGIINPGTTSGQFDDSIAVTDPRSAAVGADGTVYIANTNQSKIEVVNPGQNVVNRSIAVAYFPRSVAVNQDDTVVAASTRRQNDDGSISIIAPGGTTAAATIFNPLPLPPYGVATDSQGNFYVGSEGNSVAVINRDSSAVSRTITGLSGPTSLVVGPDDTLYVANRNTSRVELVTAGDSSPSRSISAGQEPVAIAVSQDGDVFVSNFRSNDVSLIVAGASTSSVLTPAVGTHGVAVTRTGLVYIAQSNPASVIVMANVGATLPSPSGQASTTTTVNISGLPANVLMDDSTVTQVWWGDDTVAFTRIVGSNAVALTVPDGTESIPVVVELNGGRAVTAGSFTYVAAPAPVVPVPAGPPVNVQASAGAGSVEVSWAVPASVGSFPVTHYLVTSSPPGGSCLTSSTSCTVEGVIGGVEYTFTVQALTGAGWGARSAPSNPVVAVTPSISISASKDVVRGRPGMVVAGVTTGLAPGTQLRAWVRLSPDAEFRMGRAGIVVDDAGRFVWERRLNRPATVFIAASDRSVMSPRKHVW